MALIGIKMTTRSNLGLYFSGTYIPYLCDISSIVRGVLTVVTTAIDHGFILNNQVQFQIPPEYGMVELNGLKGYVRAFTLDTITVDIDSTSFQPFVIPTVTPPVVISPAQVLPIGNYSFGYQLPGGSQPTLQIPGTFRNTYP